MIGINPFGLIHGGALRNGTDIMSRHLLRFSRFLGSKPYGICRAFCHNELPGFA